MTRNQTIYTILISAGLTEAGALGMMGNWECESNLEPGRLQGDFHSFRTSSKNYTARVTSGELTKETFANDSKGYGLAQWTLAYRKRKLWEFWKASGMALDSEVMQTRFALSELQTEGEYAGLFQMLKTSGNLAACTEAVCRNYERPAENNIADRCSAALFLQKQFSGFKGDVSQVPTAKEEPVVVVTPAIMPQHEFWPPRVICEGMKGPDVEVLCALLKAQEYGVNFITPEFTSFLTEKVKAFQKANGLKADGIVGPLTWAVLLKITKF